MIMFSWNRWILSIFLMIPVFLLFYSHHHHATPDKIPSYFLQDDFPYYLSVAREYFDTGHSPFFYGNPFSPEPETPRHYFQPPTFILSLLIRWIPMDPGLLFLVLGCVAGIGMIRATFYLFEEFLEIQTTQDLWIFILFLWGGGLLSAGGAVHSLLSQNSFKDWLLFDPAQGWWLIHLGRNLLYPLESIYHILFFIGLGMWIQKRWGIALIVAFLLSISHPFTGIQFLLISNVWLFIERRFQKERLPFWVFPASLSLTLGHLLYYLVWLNRDPEHHSLMQEWKINFSMHEITFLLFFTPLLICLWWGLRKKSYVREWLGLAENRLLLIGFIITLGLVFHDRFIPPTQPLHFNRGYLWVFLFLISIPALKNLFRLPVSGQKTSLTVILSIVLLSDNLSWFIYRTLIPTGHYYTQGEVEVLKWLRQNTTSQDLLISEDRILSYLAPVYSSIRPWYAFGWFTPYGKEREAEQKLFFEKGIVPLKLKHRSLIILQKIKSHPYPSHQKRKKLFKNKEFQIYQTQIKNTLD